MPNVNFTSSSIAQQDRFAQTTVSYESRNMQSIPFYPDKNYTAKMRGIMATSIIVCAILGAIGGLIFGFRDYIFSSLTPVRDVTPAAETAEAMLPEDIELSLAANTLYNIDIIAASKDVEYNGKPQMIEGKVGYDHGLAYTISHSYYNNATPNDVITVSDPKTEGPVDAGEYTVIITLSGDKIETKTVRCQLKINKATIKADSIGIITPGGKNTVDYTGEKVRFSADEAAIPAGCSAKVYVNGAENGYAKNAGVYNVKIVVDDVNNKARDNYETYTKEATFTIKKIDLVLSDHLPVAEVFPAKTVVYNGKSQTSVMQLLPDKIPSTVYPADFIEELKNDPSIIKYTDIDAINVGTYTIVATIESVNYNPVEVKSTLTINPCPIDKYFDFVDTSVVYNKTNFFSNESAYFTRHYNSSSDALNPWNYVAVSFSYMKDGKATQELINAGDYEISALFTIHSDNYVLNNAPAPIKFTIKKARIDTTDITVTPIEDVEYKGSNYTFAEKHIVGFDKLPAGIKIDFSEAGAKNAGEHEVKIWFYGDNYERAFVNGIIKINKAYFNGVDIQYVVDQKVTKDGKLHVPKFVGELPNGAEVAYSFNGEILDGVDRLGTYNAEIIVFDENREARFPITLTVQFNPLTIIVGLVIGIVVAIFIGFFTWLSEILIERKSFRKFARLRARILHERGGARGAIVCEGRTFLIHTNSEMELRDFPWIPDPRFGRLYLTHATLEFYDSNYKNNYRNILIQLKEVTGVEIRGGLLRNRLIVLYGRARQDFFVEPNTAYLWRRDILHFRNLQHLYPMENNVVDNDYPFNYDVITDGD